MISARLRHLQARRAQLVALAARQRDDLAAGLRALSGPVRLVDRGIAAWHYLKARPLWLAAGVALIVALQRRRAVAWMSGALALWRLYRTVRLRLTP
ncbi:MAG TPA: YqjK family protein [Burkholderiales bacterium]|jgi:hypothetical protein|nr:YqjK family protein [Burkholderiales bacterium]